MATANTHEVKIEYRGRTFRLYLPVEGDHIQETIRKTETFYEIEMLECIQRLATPGALAVDAGANVGNHTLFLAGVCGMRVLSFEPESTCFDILERNVARNALGGQVTLHRAALGARAGRGEPVIEDPRNLGMTRFHVRSKGGTPMVALDRVPRSGRVQILKVDVEGMEEAVLKGAGRTLKEDRPMVFLEADRPEQLQALKAFLAPYGYRLIENFNWTATWLFAPAEDEAERYQALMTQVASTGTRVFSDLERSYGERLGRGFAGLRETLDHLGKQQAWIEERVKRESALLAEKMKGHADAAKPREALAQEIQKRVDRLAQHVEGVAAWQRDALKATAEMRGALETGQAAGREMVARDMTSLRDKLEAIQRRQEASGEAFTAGVTSLARAQEHQDKTLADASAQTRALRERLASLDDTLGSVVRRLDGEAELLAYLRKQNQWTEERIKLETGRIQQSIQSLARRLEAMEARDRQRSERSPRGGQEKLAKRLVSAPSRVHAELRTVLRHPSVSAAWLDLRRHPLDGMLRMPGRVVRTVRYRIGRRPPRPAAAPVQRASVPAATPPPRIAPPATAHPPAQPPARSGETLFDDRTAGSWGAWQARAGVRLAADGAVTCTNAGGMPGLVRKRVPVTPGGYYRLRLEGDVSNGDTAVFWIVRNADRTDGIAYYNENQVPVLPLRGRLAPHAPGLLTFRVWADTHAVDLHLVLQGAKDGESVRLDRVALETVTPEEACPRPRMPAGEKVIASMASIPGREHLLYDAMMSLVPQVDELRVFLNNFDELPGFLLPPPPNVQVERSQHFADDGDGNKLWWAVRDSTPGYRFTVDDDLHYPVDYVDRMVRKLRQYQDRVVVGLHGSLLKQPIQDYFDPKSRHVRHHRNACEADYCCHLLGTGAAAYHTSALAFRPGDFPHRNMLDVWFAKLAQEQRVPMVCIERPNNWVPDRPHAEATSIYAHSQNASGSAMDTGWIHTVVVGSHLYPVTVQPAAMGRLKVVMAVKTYNRADYLRACLASFLGTRSTEYEWVVIVADDGSTDETLPDLDGLQVQHEVHIIRNHRRYAVGQTNTIFELCERIGFDVGFCVDDDLVFTQPGWDRLYVHAIQKSGYTHIVHRHLAHCLNLVRKQQPDYELPAPAVDASGTLVAYGDCHFDAGTGSLFTFTPETLRTAGFCDEENFPIRGQWHGDYHIRCCRAGCNDESHMYDAMGSNDFLEIQNYLSSEYRCAIPWGDDYRKTREPAELERRRKIMADPSRVYIAPPATPVPERGRTVNTFFDKVYALNLDRRPDRWGRLTAHAERSGVGLHRFPAVDGRASPHAEAYAAYAARPLAEVPAPLRIGNSHAFYRDYPSHMARVAWLEQTHKRKAIASPGAWGYLLSMRALLEEALKEGHEQILVLDDDVLFHQDFCRLFEQIVAELPARWKILQLGTLQYHWEEPSWIQWHSDRLYCCQGSSVGSHAVGMHRDVLLMVLNECCRMDLPYDEGPLHKPKSLFPDQCFTCYPNLLIQDTTDSDISTTTSQFTVARRKDNVYRWKLDDYLR